MSITLKTKGIDYDGFTSVKVFRSFTNLSGAFSFTSVSSENIVFPIEVGDSCQIEVDGEPVITGFVEKINVSYKNDVHVITIEGRDRTCDLIDSTIDNTAIYNPPITLSRVIQNSLKALGITNINVIQNINIPAFNKTEIQSAEIGEPIFSFIERLCRLRQVVLTTDGRGNILIDQASKSQINTVLLSQINNYENNILESSSDFDFTKRFNFYRVYSQANSLTMVDIPQTPAQLTNRRGQTGTDPEIRSTRKFNFISEKSATDDDLKKRAIWEANIRRARSKLYSCVVRGFTATNDGIIWKPNLLVLVDDQFCRTQGLMLIRDVTYSFSISGGSTTELSLVVKDAFTLQAEQDARDARANYIGKGMLV